MASARLISLSLSLSPDNVTLHIDGVLYYRVVEPYNVSLGMIRSDGHVTNMC